MSIFFIFTLTRASTINQDGRIYTLGIDNNPGQMGCDMTGTNVTQNKKIPQNQPKLFDFHIF